ncbi:globin domain-containing protein [Sorangium sp. So ce1099]|uniref:globin domain-containing protein n=1 Tax=Sorangium sp. So ce1099 TaxID=3133331 RepID=UPI003F5F087E
MSSQDAELLRDSFELVVQRDHEFPRRFYEVLFERHPQARPLFTRNSPGAQGTMFERALMAALDHLEDDTWLSEKLAPLGAQHVAYGVTPEMYDWFGEALVAAVREVSAADWTEAHRDAWTRAYGVIVARMRAGEGAPARLARGA